MTDYDNLLSKYLEQLKQGGHYRYFLDVDKSAQHFPRFYYKDRNGEKRRQLTGAAMITWA
jgi:hypothetical protein